MKKVFLAFTAALFSILAASAANVVTVSDVTLTKGRTGTISVAMENDKPYTAFQMKLNLPQGITLVSVTKGARMDESHSLSCQPATGMIACLSTVNALFTGNSGELFTITVSVSDDFRHGTAHVQVNKIVLRLPGCCHFRQSVSTRPFGCQF